MRSARDRVLEPPRTGIIRKGSDGMVPPFWSTSRTRAGAGPSRRPRDSQLRGLPFFDDLPEVRCQPAIVTSKHLIERALGPIRRLPSPFFALGGFGLVLLHFGLKFSHHGTTPCKTHNSR